MVGFAIAHSYTFTYIEYLPSTMMQYQQQYIQQQQQQQQLEQQQRDPLGDENDTCDQYQSSVTSIVAENSSERCQDQSSPILRDPKPTTMIPTNSTILYHEEEGQQQQAATSYRPPATLPRPMNFTDALWSSTVPKETIDDIKKLRVNIDNVIERAHRERSSGSQDYKNSSISSLTNINDGDYMNQHHNQPEVNEEQEIVFTVRENDRDVIDRAMTTGINRDNASQPTHDESDLFPDLLLDLVVDSTHNSKTDENR
jgi:hypothetical protein